MQELDYNNNTGVAGQPYDDQAEYTATVTPSASVVSAGTPVVLSGVATMTSNGDPAANVPVAVQILVDGTTRTLTATTNASGDFSVTFQPLPDEAGTYSVTAADPGVTNPAVQAEFEIVGMTASPATGNVTVVPNTPLTGTFALTNLSDVTLTGLTASFSGAPAGMSVQLTVPSEIAGDGTAQLSYTLNDTATQGASGVITIALSTTQGAVLDLLVGVSVDPLEPVLAANPGYLDTGMVVGGQTLVSFTVVNDGGAPSGALQVNLPSTSYMTLASPATIPSLAPGASTTVTVELTPPSNLPLEEYTGSIGISGDGHRDQRSLHLHGDYHGHRHGAGPGRRQLHLRGSRLPAREGRHCRAARSLQQQRRRRNRHDRCEWPGDVQRAFRAARMTWK